VRSEEFQRRGRVFDALRSHLGARTHRRVIKPISLRCGEGGHRERRARGALRNQLARSGALSPLLRGSVISLQNTNQS